MKGFKPHFKSFLGSDFVEWIISKGLVQSSDRYVVRSIDCVLFAANQVSGAHDVTGFKQSAGVL